MNADNDTGSFGEYLKSNRVSKGLSLREIADATKISICNLENLENNNLGELPSEVFVKGFIRAYSDCIGVNPGKALALYFDNKKACIGQSKKFPIVFYKYIRKIARFSISAGVIASVISASVYGASFFYKKQQNNSARQVEINENIVDQKSDVASRIINKEAGTNNVSKKLELIITGVEKTLIKVIIDGQSPQQYIIEPGDRLELNAFDNYNMLIDNAKGVALLLNGKPVKILGRNGQMVNIQLPF